MRPLITLMIYLVVLICESYTQENTSKNIANSLIECYNETRFTIRDNLLPSTIEVLISLIQKIEEGNTHIDARQISTMIIQRFRQDGIWKNEDISDSSLGLPYVPKGVEAYKNFIQLKFLTPGSAQIFNNNSLTRLERCSLHTIVSRTMIRNVRGDEAEVCNNLAKYTMRLKRDEEFSERIERNHARSECPIESGVIYTKWGAVKAGTLLSGIASGFEIIKVNEQNREFDNRYASTVAGDLSELVLNQGSLTLKIGVTGGWNSTVLPKYYFVQNKEKTYITTNAELRGAMDGLTLALGIDNWKKTVSNIKVSQILDYYYSNRGVLNTPIKACTRQTQFFNVTSSEILKQETEQFTFLLNNYGGDFSAFENSMKNLSHNAVSDFTAYIASQLKDPQCSNAVDGILVQRIKTDLLIFIDNSWDYKTISNLIGLLLHKLDVKKFESSYTILSGLSGEEISNRSSSILDFFQEYNETTHNNYSAGFDYEKVFLKTEALFRKKLDNTTDLTGQSLIALYLPAKSPNVNERSFMVSKKELFKKILPDIKLLIVGKGSGEDLSDILTNKATDFFNLEENSDENQIKTIVKKLEDRIREIPRSVINPNCKSNFASGSPSTFDLEQNVEPGGINKYRISPNYFYSKTNSKQLKVNVQQSSGKINVCASQDSNPESNPNNCKNVTDISNQFELDLSNFCKDDSFENCASIYLSLKGVSSNLKCRDVQCRFPDNIKYAIRLENVDCFSGSFKIITNIGLIILSVMLVFLS